MVNALDLVVLGKHDGTIDVSAQRHIVVDNNYVWTSVVAFGVFDRDIVHASYFVAILPWARLLLVFILLQPNLLLIVFFYK